MKTKKEIIENATPYVPAPISGVYFLINRHDEIIYVGFSEDVLSRLKEHRLNHFVKFDRYHIEEIKGLADGRNLEQWYIKKLRPELNVVHNNEIPFRVRTGFKSRRDLTWLKEELDALEFNRVMNKREMNKKERERLDNRKITGFVKKEDCKKENGL